MPTGTSSSRWICGISIQYIDPTFRDRAPRVVKGENGKERLVIEEHMVGDSRIGIGGVGARQGIVEADTMAYKTASPAGSTRTSASPTWMTTA